VLVIDSTLESRLKRSPRRAAFYCNAVAALDTELQERESRLIVRRGPLEHTMLEIAGELNASGAAWSASYDDLGIRRDNQLQSALEERGLAAAVVHDAPAIAPEESAAIHSGDGPGYRAFAPYFEAWSQLPITSREYPLLLRFADVELTREALPQPSEFDAAAGRVAAGSTAARRVLDTFLRARAAQYATQVNVPAEDGTSHLAPHLSFGTISARTVACAARERLADPFSISEHRLSLRLFLRALAHRDFFLQLSWFNPTTSDEPLQAKMRAFRWEESHPRLDAWCEGFTGYPLVDAGIRQLRETGWMHPHVRAVTASFLCFDLGVDWRVGRAQWDRWLVEDDSALATGNWQWIAGVGADMAQYPRIYNPERQRRRYDPAGLYVRNWIHELEGVPIEAFNGVVSDSPQLRLPLFADDAYPQPILDHAVAARAFLRRYREFASP